MNKNNKLVGYCCILCCVIGMILSYYGYGMYTFYLAYGSIVFFLCKVANKRILLSYSTPFMLFVGCYLLLRVLHFSLSDVPLGTLLMILFLGLFQGQIHKECFIKVYNNIAKINVFYLFVQILFKSLFNIVLPGLFLFLPLTVGTAEDVDVGMMADVMENRTRFSGFFIEPSHLAAFLLPLISINLFYKRNYRNVVLYVFAILLSRSGVGLVGLMVITICFAIYRMRTMCARQIVSTIFIFLLFSSSVFWIVNNGYADEIVQRQEELDMDNDKSSGFVRIVRGYFVYDIMSPRDKLFGASNSTVQYLIQRSDVASSFALQGDEMIYLNFIQRILIYGGALSLLLFVLYYLRYLRLLDNTGKCCLSIFFVLCFMSGMNFNAQMLLMMTTTYMFRKNQYEKIKTIRI